MKRIVPKLLFTAPFLAMAVVGVAANVGARDSLAQKAVEAQHARDQRDLDAIKAGKGRSVTAGNDRWMAFWRNCQWMFVKTHETPIEVDSPGSPNGKAIIVMTTSSQEEFKAQLPAQDPACDNVSPTPEQTTAMQREVEARNAVAQGLPPDWKPPVDIQLMPTRPAG
ncbi:MAG: hypothetical protein ACRD12_19305 [Acidimicrobiales bacterium]